MDKNTLSNYGWIVIAVLVLSVMIALATPFGQFIQNGVESTLFGLINTSDNAFEATGLLGNKNNIGDNQTGTDLLPDEKTLVDNVDDFWEQIDEWWQENDQGSVEETPIEDMPFFYKKFVRHYEIDGNQHSETYIFYENGYVTVSFDQEYPSYASGCKYELKDDGTLVIYGDGHIPCYCRVSKDLQHIYVYGQSLDNKTCSTLNIEGKYKPKIDTLPQTDVCFVGDEFTMMGSKHQYAFMFKDGTGENEGWECDELRIYDNGVLQRTLYQHNKDFWFDSGLIILDDMYFENHNTTDYGTEYVIGIIENNKTIYSSYSLSPMTVGDYDIEEDFNASYYTSYVVKNAKIDESGVYADIELVLYEDYVLVKLDNAYSTIQNIYIPEINAMIYKMERKGNTFVYEEKVSAHFGTDDGEVTYEYTITYILKSKENGQKLIFTINDYDVKENGELIKREPIVIILEKSTAYAHTNDTFQYEKTYCAEINGEQSTGIENSKIYYYCTFHENNTATIVYDLYADGILLEHYDEVTEEVELHFYKNLIFIREGEEFTSFGVTENNKLIIEGILFTLVD